MMKQPHSPFIMTLLKSAQRVFPLSALLCIVLLNISFDFFSPTAQLIVLGVVIALFGLPHGALDPWIAERIGLQNTPQQRFLFNVGYLALAALVILFWWWLPALSLTIFLGISAWHFSADWAPSLSAPLRLIAGALLLLMPISFHTESVSMIFQQLSNVEGGKLASTLALPAWFLVTMMAVITAVTVWKQQWQMSLEFISLIALAYFTPPLIYFTLYFCLLHSPRHLYGLFSDAPTAEHPRLMRMMVTYTLATLLLLVVLWWIWPVLPINTLILKFIFIGLAAVTVPHMVLIAVGLSASKQYTHYY
jgi:Brp/Blh family beta-carotene 15,15'-monooxygenase